MNDRVDEDTVILAQLAHDTANGINKNLAPDARNMSALLDHRTILANRNPNQQVQRTRLPQQQNPNQNYGQNPQMQPRPQIGYNQQPRRPYIPDGNQSGDFNSVPLIDGNVNSIPLNSGPPPLIPMPESWKENGQVPDYHTSHSQQHESNNSFSDFVIPQFGADSPQTGSQNTTPIGEMSAIVMFQQFQSRLDEIFNLVQENSKKIGRIERKLNQLVKFLNPTQTTKTDDSV